MKGGLSLGIVLAVALHAGAVLFGGALFRSRDPNYASLQKVDLVAVDETREEKKEKPKEPEKKAEEIETETEEAPDASEIVEKIELSAAASAPRLDAASLGAIEAALGGQTGGGGDFASAMDFSSGGRIGGMGKVGEDTSLDQAFSMSEIDQKPRAIFQASPVYPAGMKSTEGVVTVIFVVESTGKTGGARVEKSSHPQFEKPALDAVRQWKFEPAVKGGQRVSCKMRVPIRFQPR